MPKKAKSKFFIIYPILTSPAQDGIFLIGFHPHAPSQLVCSSFSLVLNATVTTLVRNSILMNLDNPARLIIRLLFGFVSDLKGLPKPSQSLSNSTKISTNTQMPMLSRWTVSVLYIFSEINLQLHRQSPLFLNTNYENSYRSIYSRKRLILTFPHTFRCNKKGTGESKK